MITVRTFCHRCMAMAAGVTLAALLAACGDGSSPAPVAPRAQLDVEPGQVVVGQPATLTWTSSGASGCQASGAWSGSQPASGTATVSFQTPGIQTLDIECTGEGGSARASALLAVLAAPAPAGGNTLAVTVDRGPTGDSFNMPFVSVTICVPGTSNCRTVDRVLLDTGSVGLRVMASTFDNATALPAVTTADKLPVGACGQFVSGFTWGSLRRADVRLGGATAASLPIQVISDTSAPYATIPASCSAIGFNQGTPAALGANGILGVSMFLHDCSSRCVDSIAQRVYYGCSAGGCAIAALGLESQVANPVTFLAGNNNGLSLELPPVPPGGLSVLTGTLTFGIGTQDNNQLGSATVLPTDASGNFSTVYKGRTYSRAFIDSGTNGILFDDPELPACGDFYCPPTSLQLSAQNVSPAGARATVNFSVDDINRLTPRIAAFHAVGAYGVSQTFDWGLPFFFGRRAFLALEGAQTPAGPGPYWAY